MSVAATQIDPPDQDTLELEDDDSAHCTICLDGLLNSKPVASLNCGHIFHRDCIVQWLLRSGTSSRHVSGCPTCKKVTPLSDVRQLEFEFRQIELARESMVDLPGLDENALLLLRKAKRDLEAVDRDLKETEDTATLMELEVASMKEQREQSREKESQDKGRSAELRKELEECLQKAAKLRENVDYHMEIQSRRNQVQPPRDEDPDVREERKVLDRTRPGDRARHLHEGLVNARQGEAECREVCKTHTASIATLEADIAKVQAMSSKVRRNLEETQSDRVVSDRTLLSMKTPVQQTGPLLKKVKIEEVAPAGKVALPTQGEWDPLLGACGMLQAKREFRRSLSDLSNLQSSQTSSELTSQDDSLSSSGGAASQKWGSIFLAKSGPKLLGKPERPFTQDVEPTARLPKFARMFAKQPL
mmetsp:Transcript_40700/g.93546  ORF Transcript_40700/g.93546 Transcript_40700/m.93546 type:complete len:417 (+) Transcript_40700:98-1348(+)